MTNGVNGTSKKTAKKTSARKKKSANPPAKSSPKKKASAARAKNSSSEQSSAGHAKSSRAKTSTARTKSGMQEAFVRTTDRLIIRALRSDDFEVWRAAFHTFDAPKNEWDAGGMEPEDLTRREFDSMLGEQFRQARKDQNYHFGVFQKKSGRFIGATALMGVARGVFQNAFLGYWIGNIHWGMGYAQEAVHATIDIAFEDLQVHRVEAGIAPGNKSSIQLAKRLGMRHEGLSRKRVYLNESWQDLQLYALTTEDFGFSFEP